MPKAIDLRWDIHRSGRYVTITLTNLVTGKLYRETGTEGQEKEIRQRLLEDMDV